MNHSHIFKLIYTNRWVLTLMIVISLHHLSTGQEVKDTVQFSDSIPYIDTTFNFYMFDLNYTNNTIKTKGTNPDITIPAYIGSFTFLHKSGLSTGLMYTNYSSADSLSYDLDLQLGYQKSFFKDKFDIEIEYLYHHYKGVTDYEGINYKHALNLSTGYTYKMLYLYGEGNFYLDNENYFTNFGLSLNIDFDNVIAKNDYLFLLPTLSFTYGTDYWLYDIYDPYIQNVLLPYLQYRGYQTNLLTTEDIVERYMENQGLNTNTFSYQGIDFLVPVTYGFGSIAASFSWMYYIPSDKLKAFGMKDQSGYIISLSFIF